MNEKFVGVADIEALNKELPKAITEWLRVEQVGEAVKVTPCKYLADDWAKVMSLYDKHGGRWVKAGKESHWVFNMQAQSKLPQPQQPKKSGTGKITQTKMVSELVKDFEALRQHLIDFQNVLEEKMTKLREAGY